MNIAVTYYSRTGNTKKVAEAIANASGCTSQDVVNFKIDNPVDLLFIGGAIYGSHLDDSLQQFIVGLSPEKVRRAVVFSTYAFGESANMKMKDLLEKQGIQVDNRCFTCKGKFLFFNKKRPRNTDLDKAKEFAAAIIR